MGKQHNDGKSSFEQAIEDTVKKNTPPPISDQEAARKRLEAFENMDDSDMAEGTATYKKFEVEGESITGIFLGVEMRKGLDNRDPERETEVAFLRDSKGQQIMIGQTIPVNELKKKWDKVGETGFPTKIIFTGWMKKGTPEQYQNFRVLFEK